MRKIMRITLLLAVVMLFSLGIIASAATISDSGWDFSVTDKPYLESGYTATCSDGKISLSATGYKVLLTSYTRTVSITLTNSTGVKQVLSGDMSFSGNFGSYTITLPNGTKVTGSSAGSYSENITMESGQTLAISITSPSGSGTISCSYAPTVTASSSKVITCNTASNGTYTVNGSSESSVSFEVGDTLTLLATPDSGYVCLGFLVDGTLLLPMDASGSISWIPTDSHTITPVFGQLSTTSAPFLVNGKYYYTWETAFAAAGTNGTVILVETFTLPTTYADQGMTGAGTYVTGTDGELVYTVPAGMTLLLPYSDDDTTIKSGTSTTNDFAHANVQFPENEDKLIVVQKETDMDPLKDVLYTLTLPKGATLEVNGTNSEPGRVVIGGTIVGSQGTNVAIAEGLCYGAHSNLVVNGTLNLKDYSILSAVGYVLGDGEINATGTGAKLYQPLVIHDWRGGRAAMFFVNSSLSNGLDTQSGEDQICPFFQWTTINIQPKLTMTYGNQMILYASLYDDAAYCSHSVLVGADGSGLVQLSENASLTSQYEDITWGSTYEYGFPGRNSVTISGDAKLGSLTLYAKLALGSVDVDTSNFTLPISYAYSITLASGEFSIDKSMSLLPGSKIKVSEEATLRIGESESVRFMVFDGLNQRLAHSIDSTGLTVSYAANARSGSQSTKLYPTTAELQAAKVAGSTMSADAELIVDGTLVIGENANFGGLVQTNGNGKIDATAGTDGATIGTTVQIGVVGEKFILTSTSAIVGMSLHTLEAQLVSAATGERFDIVRGNTYYAAEKTTTQDSYSFKFYTSSADTTVYTDVTNHPLNETIYGAWACDTHTDEDSDDQCDVCGSYYVLKIVAANVAVGDSLDLYFYVYADAVNECGGPDSFYAVLEKYDCESKLEGTQTIEGGNWGEYTFEDTDKKIKMYRFCYSDIPAKEMTDTVAATIYYTGTTTQACESRSESVESYALRELGRIDTSDSVEDSDEKLRTALVDMLNYGAECQKYFKYGTGTLANAKLTDTQKGYATPSNPQCTTSELSNLNALAGVTISMKNKLMFTFYFDEIEIDSSTVTVTITDTTGNELENVNVSASLYSPENSTLVGVDVSGISYANTRLLIVCALKDSNGNTITATDSIEGYVARYNGESPEVFTNLMKFSDSACAYFDSLS